MLAKHALAAVFALTAVSFPAVATEPDMHGKAVPAAAGDQAKRALIERVRGYASALQRGETALRNLAARPIPPKATPAERALWQKYVAFMQSAAARSGNMRVELDRAVAKAEHEPVPVATETLSAASDDHLAMVDNFTQEAGSIHAGSGSASALSARLSSTLTGIITNLK